MAKAAKQTSDSLKAKSADELNTQVAELKKELFNLRFQKASGELKSTARFSQAKKEIARILTHLRQREAA